MMDNYVIHYVYEVLQHFIHFTEAIMYFPMDRKLSGKSYACFLLVCLGNTEQDIGLSIKLKISNECFT